MIDNSHIMKKIHISISSALHCCMFCGIRDFQLDERMTKKRLNTVKRIKENTSLIMTPIILSVGSFGIHANSDSTILE